MRVAYLVNQYPTVSHTFIRREILELERLGHVVERYSIRDTRESLVDPLDKEESKQTYCLLRLSACLTATVQVAITRPLRFLKALAADLALWRNAGGGVIRHVAYLMEACRLCLQAKAAEHLHAHFGTNSTSVAMLCYLLGGPKYSFTVHGPEEFDRPEKESLPDKIARADFVVAVCSFGQAQLQRWSQPWHWSKIAVVRCGLSDDLIAGTPAPIPVTNRLVCVARLSPQKGLLLLLDAAEKLTRSSIDFEVVLVGDGPLRSQIEEKITATGLADRVRLVGAQSGSQVQSWLDSSRCFVLPSFAEGLPVVIMESFARGRPVISTYVAGIPELVTNENGWLVPAGSVDELVAAMRQALESPVEELYQMGLRGRERVLELHSARKQARQLAELFRPNRGLRSTPLAGS